MRRNRDPNPGVAVLRYIDPGRGNTENVEIFRFVFGSVFLACGVSAIVCRRSIYSWQQRRGLAYPSVPMYWTVLGGLFAVIGICWLVVGFADL